MEKTEIIRLLNEDIRLEHGAIIQYLQHAYVIGEGDVRSEIEEIAREEMYHLQWLSEAVVSLGGLPVHDRSPLFLDAPDPQGLMDLNFEAEEMAIRTYLDHISHIDDPQIVALLERILRDEREHQDTFTGLKVELTENPPLHGLPFGPQGAEGVASEDVRGLNDAFQAEYDTMLQYLRESFVGFSCPGQRRLSDLSIESMKHMGWLAERMVDLRGKPDPTPLPVPQRGDPRAASLEKIAGLKRLYGRILSDQDLTTRDLIERIQGNEAYQAQVFQQGPEFPGGNTSSWDTEPTVSQEIPVMWTIGSLKGHPIGDGK